MKERENKMRELKNKQKKLEKNFGGSRVDFSCNSSWRARFDCGYWSQFIAANQ